MGGAPCLVIILDGNLAYGVVNKFSDKHPTIDTYMLEAAIEASCQSISFAGLYYFLKEKDSLESKYTQPIIHLHEKIANLLTIDGDKHYLQGLVDDLAGYLIEATRKLQELFD